MIYRIYVSSTLPQPDVLREIRESLERHFLHAATIIPCFGVWADSIEPSYLIEVIGTVAENLMLSDCRMVAADLCTIFSQSSVLLTTNATESVELVQGTPTT